MNPTQVNALENYIGQEGIFIETLSDEEYGLDPSTLVKYLQFAVDLEPKNFHEELDKLYDGSNLELITTLKSINNIIHNNIFINDIYGQKEFVRHILNGLGDIDIDDVKATAKLMIEERINHIKQSALQTEQTEQTELEEKLYFWRIFSKDLVETQKHPHFFYSYNNIFLDHHKLTSRSWQYTDEVDDNYQSDEDYLDITNKSKNEAAEYYTDCLTEASIVTNTPDLMKILQHLRVPILSSHIKNQRTVDQYLGRLRSFISENVENGNIPNSLSDDKKLAVAALAFQNPVKKLMQNGWLTWQNLFEFPLDRVADVVWAVSSDSGKVQIQERFTFMEAIQWQSMKDLLYAIAISQKLSENIPLACFFIKRNFITLNDIFEWRKDPRFPGVGLHIDMWTELLPEFLNRKLSTNHPEFIEIMNRDNLNFYIHLNQIEKLYDALSISNIPSVASFYKQRLITIDDLQLWPRASVIAVAHVANHIKIKPYIEAGGLKFTDLLTWRAENPAYNNLLKQVLEAATEKGISHSDRESILNLYTELKHKEKPQSPKRGREDTNSDEKSAEPARQKPRQ